MKLLTALAASATNMAQTIGTILHIGKLHNPDKAYYHDTPVGAGYWALRKTTTTTGRVYTKLVKRDNSLTRRVEKNTLPSIGARTDRPLTRRSRRNVPRAS